MTEFIGVGAFVLALILFLGWVARLANRTNEPPEQETGGADPTTMLELALPLYDLFNAAGKITDITGSRQFRELVEYMSSGGYSNQELLEYYRGENLVLACAAIAALGHRSDGEDLVDPVLEPINGLALWTREFALQCLDRRYDPQTPLVAPLLAKVDPSWWNPASRTILKKFVRTRLERGEKPELTAEMVGMPEDEIQFLSKMLGEIEPGSELVQQLHSWEGTRVDLDYLNSIGQVWEREDDRRFGRTLEHTALLEHAGAVESALTRVTARSTLLVGESGVGKTAVVSVVGRRLQARGWTILQAGNVELLAGMIYVGQLEERLRELVERMRGNRKVLWVIPDFGNLTMTGRHQHSATSALDFLLPFIESGEITVLGEIGPAAYQKLLQSKPRLRGAMDSEQVEPLREEATLALARDWAESLRPEDGTELVSDTCLREAWSLTRQYLWDKAAPGCLMEFLDLTFQRVNPHGPSGGRAILLDDLVATLGQLTGLPVSILDERQGLELEGLQELFGERVQGQAEAVACLVERVAMIKAGVTDPSRPQGVFLFAGPTGTGKTEIAKTLAEYLFGSPERMIRLDMSEFQEPTSMDRLLGDPSEPRDDSLVEKIRKQPFSVILLDEFEKGNEKVWDLFLQVFDDGRLTDRYGRTSNFRHAIIIMTSNLGSVIPSGTSLGFVEGSNRFSGDKVREAVTKSFRKEFLNRIDRVVVFRPLSREVMRSILEYQLKDAFGRRGLRSRTWSVEWEESAIEFLLAKGFTADMGARPLNRAIEQYLLTPLARTIVTHQFPEGDQFLFIRKGARDELEVSFIDPDAPEPESPEPVRTELDAPELAAIILSPHGTAEELTCLEARYDAIAAYVGAGRFHDDKTRALELTSIDGFWDSPERFGVLGTIETMDRVEAGFKTAGSMLERLRTIAAGGSEERARIPKQLVGRLAHQLYLLGTACEDLKDGRPREAFLLLETGDAGAGGFARQLSAMYRAWADRRGMQMEVLDETKGGADPYRFLCAVSGYGAHTILHPEAGIHVLEEPETDGKHFHRHALRVQVAPQPETPPAPGNEKQAAMKALAAPADVTPEIVRRYREQPSPLVRDNVRGYRTGRLELVLSGDFDLIS